MNVLYHYDVGSCAVARYGGIGDAVDVGTEKGVETAVVTIEVDSLANRLGCAR